uniref:ZMY12 protein n=1 Tax=Serinus canaria TaxID=9135 RepID=A0A8C9MJ05_SERCA
MGFRSLPPEPWWGSEIPLSPLSLTVPCCVSPQESLIAVALSTAQGFLWAGKPMEAIPAALQALRFSSRLSGAGRPRQAAKYLSQAQWIVLQSPDCSAALQSKLHRGLGLFSIAEGNLDQALYHLANDVYLATAEFGLNSVEVSGGYFHMANIFFHQNKMDAANSLYTEVCRTKTLPLSFPQLF